MEPKLFIVKFIYIVFLSKVFSSWKENSNIAIFVRKTGQIIKEKKINLKMIYLFINTIWVKEPHKDTWKSIYQESNRAQEWVPTRTINGLPNQWQKALDGSHGPNKMESTHNQFKPKYKFQVHIFNLIYNLFI